MDPISEEYFYTVELAKEEITSFKNEQTRLKREISKLFQENRHLTHELREYMLVKNHELSDKGILDLEHKLSAANAAKETALAMWQEAMQQLERQDDLLVGKKSLVESERSEAVKSIEQMKEQYQKGMITLSTELSSYRAQISLVKQELLSKSSDLEKCKINLDNVKQEISSTKELWSQVSSEKKALEEKCVSLQKSLEETESLLTNVTKELEATRTKNLEFSSLISDLKEQNKALKIDIAVFEKDAKDSLFAAQEAILKNKEMAFREEQYLKDIEILKSSTGIDAQKVELKCNSKIKDIQEQNAVKIRSLMSEIQLLHKENGEKQSLFEKVEREKKSLESKLELLQSRNLNDFPASNSSFDNLCKRLTMAERARDEYELKIKSLHTDLEEFKSNYEQEIGGFIKERKIFKERVQYLSKDCNQSLTDKVKLRNEKAVLEKKCSDLEKQLKHLKDKHAQDIYTIQKESDQKQLHLKDQLQMVEEHYKSVCSDLQSLLENQFKISSRWKEETDKLITQSESKITELCDTIAHLQYQNNELVNAMQEQSAYR